MKLGARRLALTAVPVLALSGVAGCSLSEQTQRWYTASDGVNADAGDIGVRNVQVVSDGEGRATLYATFANAGGDLDELTEIYIADVPVELSGSPLEIPAGGTAIVSPDNDRADGEGVEAHPGHTVPVEFHFGNAPRATVQALVRSATDVYADALANDAPAEDEAPDEDEAPVDGGEDGATGPTDAPTDGSEPAGDAAPTDAPTDEPTGSPTEGAEENS